MQKALNIFNAALVTPTYYVFFTSTTIITSAVLFRGFHGTGVTIATVVMGFFVICSGVVLLQLSKSAKDVPDAAIFKGDLDQVREVAEQEASETEPKADAIRGAASIIRRLSTPRRNMEQMEAKRLREEKLAEHLEPLKENEIAEWDGLRRRKTIIGTGPTSSPIVRRKTIHPPLGLTHFPEEASPDRNYRENRAFLDTVRERANTMFTTRNKHDDSISVSIDDAQSPVNPVALTDIRFPKSNDGSSPALPYGPGSLEEAQERIYGYPVASRKPIPSPRSKPLPASPMPSDAGLQAPSDAKRQFSFSNFLRHSRQSGHSSDHQPRPPTAHSYAERKAAKNATEEERLGLVTGDSALPLMADSSPERTRMSQHQPSEPNSTSLYNNYPYTGSQRLVRSASPDAISEEDSRVVDTNYLQNPSRPYHQPFSFSSAGPSPGTTTPQRPSSRRRPSPPAVYTPPRVVTDITSRDFAQSSEHIAPIPMLAPPQQQTGIRRITIGATGNSPPAARSVPSLEPPVQFAPTYRRTNSENSPTASGPALDEITRGDDLQPRGRRGVTGAQQTATHQIDSNSPTRSDQSQTGSKDRYAEQSARERAERRERAQRRQSQGPSSTRQSGDFS